MKRVFSLLAAALLFVSIPFSASAVDPQETINNIGTGDVEISMVVDEYPLPENILPGSVINRNVSVKNQAEPVWIRMSVQFSSEDDLDFMNDDMIHLADSKWKKVGDYWYYTEPVASKSTVQFMDELHIPTTLDNFVSEKSFDMDFQADAVQSAHFEPDFDAEDPWFGTLIEVSARAGYTPKGTGDKSFVVEWRGGAEGLVIPEKDFFSNWPNLMPGDSMTGEVKIKDAYDKITILFSTETIANDKLLTVLNLKIQKGDELIYSGPLSGIVAPVELGEYEKGDEDTITFTVSMPTYVTNEYALAKTKTKWIFEAYSAPALPASGGTGWSLMFEIAGGLIVLGVLFGGATLYLRRKERS